jgi:hypothetical protein
MTTTLRTHSLAAGVLLALTAILVRDVLRQAPCGIDEPGWITSGAVTYHLVRHLAPVSEWEHAYDRFDLGDWGNQNPPVAKLYFGVVLALAGQGTPVAAYRWTWPQSYAENLAAGTLPPPAVLTAARLGIVAVAAGALALTYLLAFAFVGNAAAILAPLVLVAVPTFREHATHVYPDLPQIACLLVAGVLLCAYARRPRWRWVIGAGLAAGLACAIKFNAAPIVGASVLIVAHYSVTRRGVRAAVVGVIPVVLFVLVNPYLYPAPVARTLAIVAAWDARKLQQQADPAHAPLVVHSRLEALRLVLQRGLLQPHVTPPATGAHPLAWGLLVVTSAGLIQLRRHPLGVAWAVLVLTHAAGTVWWLPLNWARYYLPVIIWVPPLVAIAAAAAGRAARVAWSARSRRGVAGASSLTTSP